MKRSRFFLPLGLILIAAALALTLVFLSQPVTVVVDGQPRSVRVLALTVGGALRAAGIPFSVEDRLDPPASAWLASTASIHLERARPVSVLLNGIPLTVVSSERLPEKLLVLAGVPFSPQDQLFLDGQRVLPGQALPPAEQYTVQVRPAVAIALSEDNHPRVLKSAAATLGQALWEAGVRLRPGDRLSLPAETLLSGPVRVTLRRAVALSIQVDQRAVQTHSAAETVGQALAGAGISLQGLDYADPAEDQPLPKDGKIRVVRVREEVALQQTSIPFKNEYQPDANTDLDQKRVITAGQYGLKVSRERVRYEDGKEVTRQAESEWVASQPVDQVVGLGTRASLKKLDTPGGSIEYYRTVTVYATSYSPCRQGLGKCSKSTSSGIPLRKGIVAVTLPWYRQFAGQQVYIPGYGVGVIADVGGGIPGKYWVDLGYDEENFENWHQDVTLYFLGPVPASGPGTLP